ncbi:hypothetical protein EV215_0254 [Hypnocyclicus thermotrophus]|uniref:Glycosyltransferase 2-like domain-containing protein n=1 Tax=Hypnocyclicus thermotrophus TaxID=1627895 RepID=A0AA46E159_9FUSO|nr:glycosyltransferase family 2 protein [Hypnocyclicus thermotrophus]TDT72448.1 hypothetical protein EV215_0254 [Hypnocyclicus thermotrophus]
MIDISVIIVSFNTRELLKRCINELKKEIMEISHEIIVVDNDSRDGTIEMLETEFKDDIILRKSGGNYGFGIANNLGYEMAKGKYILLLNSDAFIKKGNLKKALEKIESDKTIGVLGAKLECENGDWQPSPRSFPTVLQDFFVLSGIASKYNKSSFFGKSLMTYKNFNKEFECDWVTGAFMLIRSDIIGKKIFDERYFMYYEEVDFCLKIKEKGYKIIYYPEVEVIHLGGASTSIFSEKLISKNGMQMTLWRLQSQYLYYRKNFGLITAYSSKLMELTWNIIRTLKNKNNNLKKEESRIIIKMIKKAWENTKGGKISPAFPWKGY